MQPAIFSAIETRIAALIPSQWSKELKIAFLQLYKDAFDAMGVVLEFEATFVTPDGKILDGTRDYSPGLLAAKLRTKPIGFAVYTYDDYFGIELGRLDCGTELIFLDQNLSEINTLLERQQFINVITQSILELIAALGYSNKIMMLLSYAADFQALQPILKQYYSHLQILVMDSFIDTDDEIVDCRFFEDIEEIILNGPRTLIIDKNSNTKLTSMNLKYCLSIEPGFSLSGFDKLCNVGLIMDVEDLPTTLTSDTIAQTIPFIPYDMPNARLHLEFTSEDNDWDEHPANDDKQALLVLTASAMTGQTNDALLNFENILSVENITLVITAIMRMAHAEFAMQAYREYALYLVNLSIPEAAQSVEIQIVQNNYLGNMHKQLDHCLINLYVHINQHFDRSIWNAFANSGTIKKLLDQIKSNAKGVGTFISSNPIIKNKRTRNVAAVKEADAALLALLEDDQQLRSLVSDTDLLVPIHDIEDIANTSHSAAKRQLHGQDDDSAHDKKRHRTKKQ